MNKNSLEKLIRELNIIKISKIVNYKKINNALSWRIYTFKNFIKKIIVGESIEYYLFKYIINKNKKMSVIDIGANLGQKTDPLININKNIKVIMFEPFTDYCNFLRRKYFKNKKIKVYNFGIGNKNKKQNFYIAKEEKNSEAFSFKEMPYHHRNIKVNLKKLDSLNFLKKEKISLIKIDVEQYEYEVLKGGTKLIKHNRPFIFFETTNKNILKINKYFRNKNYLLYAYEYFIFRDKKFVFENPIKSWQDRNVTKSNIYKKKLYKLNNFKHIKSYMLNIIALPKENDSLTAKLKII